MNPDVIGRAVGIYCILILRQYPQSLNIAISLNITIGLLLTDIIVILRFDCTVLLPNGRSD